MDGQSSSSSIESVQNMSTGTESELLRIGGGQLYLLDEVESVRMGSGDFALIMGVQAETSLATLVARVAEFQWPIGRDAPVLKIASLRYTFALPGLLYGLVLPDCTALDVQKFESYLGQYCTFEIRPELAQAAGVSDLRQCSSVGRAADEAADGARYWTAVADDVESYSSKLVRQMQSGSTAAANSALKGGERTTWGVRRAGSSGKNTSGPPATVGDGNEISPRMRKRLDQARRMSAVAKLLSRTVVKGAISATGHVANFLGTPPGRASVGPDARREVVMASVDAFAQVVEAVETGGKSLALATSSVGTDLVLHKSGEQAGKGAEDELGNMVDSMWTLNKLGLYMLWRATAASTALNSRSGTTSRSTSGTSSETSIQSPTQMKSPSPAISADSVNTRLQSSMSILGRSMSLPDPMSIDEVPQTAQLFPNSPDSAQPQYYAIAPPNLYMTHPHAMQMPPPGYAAYYHSQNSISPFQHYTRPGVPPQVQPFFPHTTEPSKPQ